MKSRLIELIRSILRKIVLPLRARRKTLEGRIHLSIIQRITINYLKLLVIGGLLFFSGMSILFIYFEKARYSEMARNLISKIQVEGWDYLKEGNFYSEQGIELIIYETETNKVVYDDFTLGDSEEADNFKGITLDLHDKGHKLIVRQTFNIVLNESFFSVECYYNMTDDFNRMLKLLLSMLTLYLVIIFFILRQGKKTNKRLLKPIQVISNSVNKMTAANLHNERLNVEGTKNELKDLAIVFNNMLDRLEKSYENQKQFVSNASHELRTPIAVIQGYSNMLSRWGAKDPEVLEESIVAIKNEAKSMQELVEKLLILSRHDKKTMKLDKRVFNMRPVVEEMVKETRLVAVNRVVEVPVIEDVKVYGDKQALKQAIRVFIDNAVKYTQDGDQIKISCRNKNGDCVIMVEDTGIGMTRVDMDNIFNRFYRSDHVRDRKIEGHGLGLSIAKVIIMSHTGRIKIRSQYTKGTSFIVTIPRIRFYD